MPSDCCQITDDAFDDETARGDLEDYRSHGPARHTQLILEAVHTLRLNDASLLDIGGGVGAIHHELLADGFSRATHVDASSAYLSAAREESEQRGYADRVKFIHADFTDVALALPQADLVTLDRVVCCYPDFRALLKSAAAKSLRALAMSYPRDGILIRASVWFANLFERLRGEKFQAYVHPRVEMDAVLQSEGMVRVFVRRLIFWEVAMYVRPESQMSSV